jgi:hydrogenase/urease accessory protein HupE
MPDAASAPTYASGFMPVAALPHMVGIALGMLIGRIGAAGSWIAFRLAGALVALAGIVADQRYLVSDASNTQSRQARFRDVRSKKR